MYINYKGQKYPCRCRPGAAMVYRGLPDNFPAPVSGEISLCADDGFILRTDDPADYLRQTFADGVLTLTNAPEPESAVAEEEGPTIEERLGAVEEAILEIAAAIEVSS